ncbi:hypothetical protein ACWDA3_59200 [Nonomuraea rubra]
MNDDRGRWVDGFGPTIYAITIDQVDHDGHAQGHVADREGADLQDLLAWAMPKVAATPHAAAQVLADGNPIGWIERSRAEGTWRAHYRAF